MATTEGASLQTVLEERRERHVDELLDFLQIPSISTDSRFAEDVARCAEFVRERLDDLGFATEVVPTKRHPVVVAERRVDPSLPTVLIYGHYDVQPPGDEALWISPPFEPRVDREAGRIYARGASDNKGQIYAHIKGAEARIAADGDLPVNVVFVIEGEEEIGSPNLEAFLAEHADRLRADTAVISDMPMWAPGRPAICYGLRGLAYFEATFVGPERDLHSGLFGGVAPNPLHAMARAIASLHDESGRVAIPGFYDDVRELDADERAAFEALSFDEEALRRELGTAATGGERDRSALERMWARPTLDCNGAWGGYTGEGAKTVIPARAHAKLSCRLVPDQDPRDIREKLVAHLEARAPAGTTVEVRALSGAPAILVERDSEPVRAASAALRDAWDEEPVFIRGGGSIPVVASLQKMLGLDTVMMGFGLDDDRIHSENEKYDLACYYRGIEASARMFTEMAKRLG